MGQKTHPTGFRTGIYKPHSATWCANYGAYSEVLKEDYKIRQFLRKNSNQFTVRLELQNWKFNVRLTKLN